MMRFDGDGRQHRRTARSTRFFAVLGLGGLLFVVSGCADSSGNGSDAPPSQAMRAAALSLQQTMDTTSREIDVMRSDAVRSTRDSLERLGGSLQPAISQTGDVIVALTPMASSAGPAAGVLTAAREQRSFLQFAAEATNSRNNRRSANSRLARVRAAGRRATTAYSKVAQKQTAIAGLLPASTTFNTGRLRDAVLKVNPAKKKKKKAATPTAPQRGGGVSTPAPPPGCGDGLSVNSVTSCTFARAVRDAYQGSGGDSVIEVYSTVTHQSYTMSCSGGLPAVCRGGNNAVVTIR